MEHIQEGLEVSLRSSKLRRDDHTEESGAPHLLDDPVGHAAISVAFGPGTVQGGEEILGNCDQLSTVFVGPFNDP